MLATAAVLLRCFITPGVMLDPTAVAWGELKLVICTSAGATPIAAAPDQAPVPDQEDNRGLCPYAAPSHAGMFANVVSLGAERFRPAFKAPSWNTAHQSPQEHGFEARAPPKFS